MKGLWANTKRPGKHRVDRGSRWRGWLYGWGTILCLMIIGCELLQNMVSHVIVQSSFCLGGLWAWYCDHIFPVWDKCSDHECSVGNGVDCTRLFLGGRVGACACFVCEVDDENNRVSPDYCDSPDLSQGGDCWGYVSYPVYDSSSTSWLFGFPMNW